MGLSEAKDRCLRSARNNGLGYIRKVPAVSDENYKQGAFEKVVRCTIGGTVVLITVDTLADAMLQPCSISTSLDGDEYEYSSQRLRYQPFCRNDDPSGKVWPSH